MWWENELDQEQREQFEAYCEFEAAVERGNQDKFIQNISGCPEGHDHTSDCRREGCPCDDHAHAEEKI